MAWPNWLAIAACIFVPLVLWGIFWGVAKSRRNPTRALAILIGSDNRLSLSRAQALAWTLVIIGSWTAAMAAHTFIEADHAPADRTGVEKSKADAQKRFADLDIQRIAAPDAVDKATRELDRFRTLQDSGGDKYKADLEAVTTLVTTAQQDEQKANADLAAAGADKDKVTAAKTKAGQTLKEALAAKTKLEQDRANGLVQLQAALKVAQNNKADIEAQQKNAENTLAYLTKYDWVQIPPGLLALAAIAIGSGVFSSLIAAYNSDQTTAAITYIHAVDRSIYLKARKAQPDPKQSILTAVRAKETEVEMARAGLDAARETVAAAQRRADDDEAAAKAARAAATADPANQVLQSNATQAEQASQRSASDLQTRKRDLEAAEQMGRDFPGEEFCLIITGAGMKKEGTVKFNRTFARIREWSDDGTNIIVDVPKDLSSSCSLVVDTANGKLCYSLVGKTLDLGIGEPTSQLDLVDLFRDDKNPLHYDLMKFQMFAWTVVAIGVYMYLFLHDLHSNMSSLPVVDQTIVTLTGLSQAGYLTSKAVSNVNRPNPTKAVN